MNDQKIKNEPPLVDILVPTYNHELLISETVDSILAQDYPYINIILSDDASTDGTQKIIKQYKEKYPNKITLNINKKNMGIVRHINHMIEFSSAQYISLFAGDDLMRFDKISKQIAKLIANPFASGCMSDVEVFFTKTGRKFLYKSKVFSSCSAGRIIRVYNQVPSASLMINRKIFGEPIQDERLKVVGDWLLVNEVAIKGMVYISEPLTIYRRHSSNTTAGGIDKIYVEDRLISIDLLFARYKKYAFSCKVARSNVYLSAAIKYLKAKKLTNFLYFLWSSWLEMPININFFLTPVSKLYILYLLKRKS